MVAQLELGSRPSALNVLSPAAREITALKFVRRHRLGSEASVLVNNEFVQQVNLSTRLAKTFLNDHVFSAMSDLHRAQEHPKLAHHGAPHAKRVEYTLQPLILRTTNPSKQLLLETHPEILRATMLFPRTHDLMHQVFSGLRKLEGEKEINAKRGHDKAAGITLIALAPEYADGLAKAYEGRTNMTKDQILEEAMNTMILAQIISSPHGKPSKYEKIIGERKKKAYTIVQNGLTGEPSKVPLPYTQESEAKALFEAYMVGELDPFSLNLAQMTAITTYELTHDKDGMLVVDPEIMSDHVYGSVPHGLHPKLQEKYGERFAEMTQDARPFEDRLPSGIYDQRDLIEYMGKLSLFADTFDLVSDPTGRVVRSLLTQVTFTDKMPRPVWGHELTEADVDAMVNYARNSDGDDTDGVQATDKGYSLNRRLSWELLHWWPFKESLAPEIDELLGDISVMAAYEQFRIIEAWMHNDPTVWSQPLATFYQERVAQYEQKMSKGDPSTIFDAEWLHKEKDRIPQILEDLPRAKHYTDEDRDMFELFKEKILKAVQDRYNVTDDKMKELEQKSTNRERYESPYIRPMYDIVFGGRARGLELADQN